MPTVNAITSATWTTNLVSAWGVPDVSKILVQKKRLPIGSRFGRNSLCSAVSAAWGSTCFRTVACSLAGS